MKIAIRVDGSLFIGMGHVMRSLALGRALRRAGHEAAFLSRFEPGISRIKSQGFQVEAFHAGLPDGPGKDYEAAGDGEAVAAWLAEQGFDGVITDSYRVDNAYFSAIRPRVRFSVYVDDLNRFPAEVDGVINGNINAEALDYDRWPIAARRWLGCRYNLLREEFCELPLLPTPDVAKTILLTGGGGNSNSALAFIAESLLGSSQLGYMQLQVVAASRSEAEDALDRLAGQYPARMKVNRDVSDMLSLMRKSDLAISAGGTTLYELCAAGAPRLAYILADNQQGIVCEMERRGLLVNLGPAALLQSATLVAKTSELAADCARRRKMQQNGRELVDGKGADRAAAEIVEALAGKRSVHPS